MDIPAKSVLPCEVQSVSKHSAMASLRACAALLCATSALVVTAHAAESVLLTNPAAAIGDELGFALAADGSFVASGSPGEGGGALHDID